LLLAPVLLKQKEMVKLFGSSIAEARRRVGGLAQVSRIESMVEAEGRARGARRLRMVNGGGLEIDIYPDQCLDIGQVTVNGMPVAWMAPQGASAQAFREPSGNGWLRTFGGGLLVTCGLDTFGPPSHDGEDFGLHGRIGTEPAQVTTVNAGSEHVVVEGIVRQSRMFGENLTLRRRISSELGSTCFVVEDVVTNEGFSESPHMILYHANLGWPLLDEEALVDITSTSVDARDDVAQRGIENWGEIGPPVRGWQEQVFRHSFANGGQASAAVENRGRDAAFRLRFNSEQLPWLYQWKMLGEGAYVLGVEPSNCSTLFGRASARASGVLPLLRAGESVSYRLEFSLEHHSQARRSAES